MFIGSQTVAAKYLQLPSATGPDTAGAKTNMINTFL
jgi:hypothetical protein